MKRVYQYQDVKTGRLGRPFVLCDKHRKTYSPPAISTGECVLSVLGDNASGECELCKDSK